MATNNAINAPLPLAVSQGGTGLATLTAHGVLVGEGTSNVTPIVLGAGQVLIGTTSGDPSATTLTGGTNISITSSSGSITISDTGPASFVYQTVTTSATAAVNHGYFTNSASLVTMTLPATFAVGDIIEVLYQGTGGWKVGQPAGVNIVYGNVTTTTGTGGSIASSAAGDTIRLVGQVANTTMIVMCSQGNLTTV